MFGGAMNVAILGGSGQLGRQLVKLYPGCYAPTSTELDLYDIEETASAKLAQFDLVINCAAMHDMKKCEWEPQEALFINALAPYTMALVCKKLIHISTAYVFGNDPVWPSGRHEGDLPDPLSVYGMTKYLGECMIQLAGEQHLIVRTDALYGPGGPSGKPMSFVEGVRTGKYTRVKYDEFCNPTSCADLARAVRRHQNKLGIIHLVNQPSMSWFEFARLINPKVLSVAASEFDDGIKRPKDSGMTSKYDTGMMSVEEALAEYLELT
jgi:dTDP-4-dehydrorhamnose reductase